MQLRAHIRNLRGFTHEQGDLRLENLGHRYIGSVGRFANEPAFHQLGISHRKSRPIVHIGPGVPSFPPFGERRQPKSSRHQAVLLLPY
jgi:hypothetical protein